MPKDKEFFGGANKSTKDASGLRSANEMTDSCPEKGWGGVGAIPGVDANVNAPIRSASDSGFDPDGDTMPGQPFSTSMGTQDAEVPVSQFIDVGEAVGPNTGAGLRSAVGDNVDS